MTPGPLVVEAVRGEVVESTHLVDVAVSAADGSLVASAGEPDTVAYLRSSAKPVQATVCVELGWKPPGDPQLAVASASHNGEPPHVDAVRGTLVAAGLEERQLRCPPASPSLAGAPAPPNAFGPIYHNCSGKHAAMLAATVALGREPESYLLWDSELHRAIQRRLEELAGRPARAIGVDGCGVPTFAFTLHEAARLYGALPGSAAGALRAMRSQPFLVAGSNRICTSVMSVVPGLVLKVGAEGLMCGVLPGADTGLALKARDGAARGREMATLHVLQALGLLGDAARERVLEDIRPRLATGTGHQPELHCRGELRQA